MTPAVASRVRVPVVADARPVTVRHVWAAFPAPLRALLASDVFVRTCEGMVDVFLVLYAVNVVGVDAPRFGVLVAVQALTAILVYVPAARIAERTGKKPFVIATFVAFALFPLSVVSARRFASLGLIVDLAVPSMRARVVGLYYLGRSVAIAPAAFVGGLLWRISPSVAFFVAAAFGAVGVVVFAVTIDEEAGPG